MTGLGIAVAVVLLLWCALLFVPFRCRPVGLYLIAEKSLALAHRPGQTLPPRRRATRLGRPALERFLAVIATTGKRTMTHAGTHSKAVAP